MNTEYLTSVFDEMMYIEASVIKKGKNLIFVEGIIKDSKGNICVKALHIQALGVGQDPLMPKSNV